MIKHQFTIGFGRFWLGNNTKAILVSVEQAQQQQQQQQQRRDDRYF